MKIHSALIILFFISMTVGSKAQTGQLLINENFQGWTRDGYLSTSKIDCETDALFASQKMNSLVKSIEYHGLTVTYTLNDAAINPECGNAAGTSTDSSDVSTGYIALQYEIYYACGGHYSDAYILTSKLASVSNIEFSISATANGAGVSLYKVHPGESSYTLIGSYVPDNALKGQSYSASINDENIILKFAPKVGTTQYTRLHDLKVWDNSTQTAISESSENKDNLKVFGGKVLSIEANQTSLASIYTLLGTKVGSYTIVFGLNSITLSSGFYLVQVIVDHQMKAYKISIE